MAIAARPPGRAVAGTAASGRGLARRASQARGGRGDGGQARSGHNVPLTQPKRSLRGCAPVAGRSSGLATFLVVADGETTRSTSQSRYDRGTVRCRRGAQALDPDAARPECVMRSVEAVRSASAGRIVLTDVNVDLKRGSITALIGPTGSGKSTFLRTLNRMNDRVPGLHPRGRRHPRRREPVGAARRPADAAPARRHAVPAPEPVPDVDQGQRGRRGEGAPHRQGQAARRRVRATAHRGRPVGRRQGPPGRLALPAVGRPAAAALPGARARGRARGAAARRADLVARPGDDRVDRGSCSGRWHPL